MYKDKHIFVVGASRFKDLIYLCLRNKQLDSKGASHSIFVAYYQGKRMFGSDTDWDTIDMMVVKSPAEKLVAVSGDGNVFTYVGGNSGAEQISPVDVALRGVAVIEGYGYTCGMKRQVFERCDEGNWQPMHAPPPKKSEKDEVIGFEAMDGFSRSDIYAVGWQGEIWHYNGKKWNKVNSPTNLILTAVTCAGDGWVYACGKNGMLLKGRDDNWSVIGEGDFVSDLWDVHWFNDRLYASTLKGVFELLGDVLQAVDMGDDVPNTCFKLTSTGGVMWSIGVEDLFSFDGADWVRVE